MFAAMEGRCRMMAEPIWSGLPVYQGVTLGIKDIDLSARTVSTRNSKGSKGYKRFASTTPLQTH